MYLEKSKLFNSPALDSKIKSANTEGKERIWGYFVGPMLLYMTYYGLAGTYLTQFYTDVLQISGIVLTMMPFLSKVVDAITNVIMGRIIDKTRSRQGKARPWLLISGFLITITGFLLYAVPRASTTVRIIWVIVSYNLFFAFAFTLYNMSHVLMVPLATRNAKQRDTLALLNSTGANMIPGMLINIIMPIIVAKIGVGADAQGHWLTMMSIISIFAIPAVLVEYFFTKERVTEDAMSIQTEEEQESVPILTQLKACISDPYWFTIVGFFFLYQLQQQLMGNSMIYYCNWVLGTIVKSGAANQILVNMIGQAPLGIGIAVLWPLVRKFGKQKVMMFGFGLGAVGCLLTILAGSNMPAVLGGLMLRSLGLIPTYMYTSLLAECLDHVEWKHGFRVDGLSAALYSISITVCGGIAQSIILGGISHLGYIAPSSSDQVITQPASVRIFFTVCFVGVTMVSLLAGSLMMMRYDIEKKLPQISADLADRRRAEAEAKGIEYISPEEKAAKEQEELDRKAEENRIAELKARCAKKGLSFDEEEAKYQQKLAEKKAKAEAKAAKKNKKK